MTTIKIALEFDTDASSGVEVIRVKRALVKYLKSIKSDIEESIGLNEVSEVPSEGQKFSVSLIEAKIEE